MGGFVYVLTNAAMPGVVKIGRTRQLPRKRLAGNKSMSRHLYSDPGHFELAYSASCQRDCKFVEYALHQEFAEHRLGKRELFRVDLETVRLAVERIAKRPAHPGDPFNTGMDRWEYHRPAKPRRGNVPGGAAIYMWMFDNRQELSERIGRPDFSWFDFAHEMRIKFEGTYPPGYPVPPDLIHHLWQCVCGIAARDYEDLNRGPRKDAADAAA